MNADILLYDDIFEYLRFGQKLKTMKIFDHVYFYKKKGDAPNYPRTFLGILFFGHKTNAAWVEKTLDVDLKNYDNVFIFHDATEIGRYLMDIKKKYYLLEDAEDFFKIVMQTSSAIHFQKKHWKDFLRYYLNYGYFYLGQSRFCLSVEVNDNHNIVLKRKKIIVCPKKELQSNISEKHKQDLLELFLGKDVFDLLCKNTVLVLTEPLYVDGFVPNERIQKNIYEKIILEEQKKGNKIVLKPHPRDSVCYTSISGIEILRRDFPVEILNQMESKKFLKVIAISSTAVFGLTCVEQKILLGKNILNNNIGDELKR